MIRDSERATRKRWRDQNPEKVREYRRLDRERHRDAILARQRAYYQKNRAAVLAYNKAKRAADREAINAAGRAWRKAHPDLVRSWRDNNRKKRRAAYILYGIKKKCRAAGLAFDLTAEWLDAKLTAGVCEMSGLPFDMDGKRSTESPSVDRIDPRGGYTQNNCRLILWFLNRAMSNLGEDYALMVFERVLARRYRTLRQVA